MKVIIYGSPVNGFFLVGPFEDIEDGLRYAERHLRECEWWTMEVEAPEKDDLND